ncbi:MAG: lysophospholipid acyltransferase family protein [Sciscionella sp.]
MAIDLIWPVIMGCTRPIWRGGENIPRTGPLLLAANHISFADPITISAYALGNGRIPRYLARANLWQMPVVKWVMASGKHVPVQRGSISASDAYHAGLNSLADGNCLIVFPEATYTKDPNGWPMRGKTGIAKLALASGAPVVPIAHWGTHEVLPPGGKPQLLPRKTVHIYAGPPVDLSDLMSAEPSRQDLIKATARIMAAITDSLSEIRGERKPE